VASACLRALAAHPDGDVLCFLPGEAEVKTRTQRLRERERAMELLRET
jgi:HrpA-like RNA helicase